MLRHLDHSRHKQHITRIDKHHHHNLPRSTNHPFKHRSTPGHKSVREGWSKRLTCKTCQIRGDNILSFYRHLTSTFHHWNSLQDIEPSTFGNMLLPLPSFLLWEEKVNERSIVVTSLDTVVNTTRLLLHFVKYGLVADYIADPEGQFAVIQYHDKSCIKNLTDDSTSTRIDGGYVRIRCKDCISIIEWTILLNLDGVYERADQPFFIRHCLRMSVYDDQRIHAQLHCFIEESSLTPAGIKSQRNIRKYLFQLFLPIFPDMIFTLMQSQVPDFSEADPTLDIFMDPIGDSRNRKTRHDRHLPEEEESPYHHSPKYQAAIGKVRHVLCNLPRWESDLTKFTKEVSEASDKKLGPIGGEPYDALFFTHSESGMKCKINFDDPIAPFLGSLQELMLQIEPLLLPILKFVHYWARVHRFVQDHAGIKVVLTMMVLVYLMDMNMLPSVKALRKLSKYSCNGEKRSSHYVQGWKIDLCTHLPTILDYLEKRNNAGSEGPDISCDGGDKGNPEDACQEDEQVVRINLARNVFTHLRNFFGAFSCIDLGTIIISPCIGELVSRSVLKYARGSHPKIDRLQDSPLIVQHPFDLRRNLAANCNIIFVNQLQIEFRNTHRRICYMLGSNRPKMSSIFPKFHTLLKWEPTRCCYNQKVSDSGSRSSKYNIFLSSDSEESSGEGD